jgi:plastocyanin
MRNLTKANRSSVWCLGLCLTVAVAALGVTLTLPAVAAGIEVNIDNFAFTPNELTVKAGTTVVFHNRDDIPHSVVGQQGRVPFQGARYGRQLFIHLREGRNLRIFLWPSSTNARQDRGHTVRREGPSIPRDIRNRDPIASFDRETNGD